MHKKSSHKLKFSVDFNVMPWLVLYEVNSVKAHYKLPNSFIQEHSDLTGKQRESVVNEKIRAYLLNTIVQPSALANLPTDRQGFLDI